MDILEIKNRKFKAGSTKPLKMVTAYDYPSALAVESSPVDLVLVGDSVAMVVHGLPNTLHATLDMMSLHVAAVSRGIRTKMLIADMPFLTFRKGIRFAVEAAGKLMQSGAHAVKIEGVEGHQKVIEHLVNSGIPVMGHIGLTPQFVFQLGGFKLQGKSAEAENSLLRQAQELQSLGCFSLVLECVPSGLAKKITDSIAIPTVGIGAGPFCDGQVLVWQDLLNLTSPYLSEFKKPKFVRSFADGAELIDEALKRFCEAVDSKDFPSAKESYFFEQATVLTQDSEKLSSSFSKLEAP